MNKYNKVTVECERCKHEFVFFSSFRTAGELMFQCPICNLMITLQLKDERSYIDPAHEVVYPSEKGTSSK